MSSTTTTDDNHQYQSDKGNGGLISEHIIERKLPLPSSFKQKSASKFKKSQTKRGFPSLDRPLGTFVTNSSNSTLPKSRFDAILSTASSNEVSDNKLIESDANFVSGMSKDEFNEAMQEIQSVLSTKSIAFLKDRGQKKENQKSHSQSVEVEPILVERFSQDEVDDDFSGTRDYMMQYVEASDSSIELSDIASLLRSSLPRQRFAAAKRLFQFYIMSDNFPLEYIIKNAGPLLPSALRCNLDYLNMKKLSNKTENLLCTYTLQSLYFISKLLISRESTKTCDLSVHALYFMEDSVPTQTVRNKSTLSGIDISSPTIETNVNSSIPAKEDGENFYSDPAWVLLTRFKIIPCLAAILSSNKLFRKSRNNSLLLPECVLSIVGILSLVATRSITATTVISKNELMLELVDYALGIPLNKNDFQFLLDPKGPAYELLGLLTVLAQQSRQAADSVSFHRCLPFIQAILSIKLDDDALSNRAYKVRCRALLLWRTLLRYGLAIPHLEIFVSLASYSLSLLSPPSSVCAVEYLSAFTIVCDCVYSVVNCAKQNENDSRQRRVSFAQLEGNNDDLNLIVLTKEQERVLAMSRVWFTPFALNAVQFLMEIKSDSFNPSLLRLISARVKFLVSFIEASASTSPRGAESTCWSISDSKVQNSFDLNLCVASLDNVISSSVFHKSLDIVTQNMFEFGEYNMTFGYASGLSDDTLIASSCSLIKSVTSLAAAIMGHMESPVDCIDRFHKMVLFSMENYAPNNSISLKEGKDIYSACRLHWINSSHFVLLAFLQKRSQYVNIAESGFNEVQAAYIALIGRLQVGYEAYTVALLSNDVLNCIPNCIKGMLIKEIIYRSSRTRSQFLHSISLNHEFESAMFGIPNKGSFQLQTLRCENECSPKDRSEDPAQLLPFGQHWLFFILSSVKKVESTRSQADVDSTILLLTSTLSLLIDLEESKSSSSPTLRLHVGAKLYYLCNLLLHDEEIWCDENLQRLFKKLLQKYLTRLLVSENKVFTNHFMSTCHQHSNRGQDVTNIILNEDSSSSLDDFLSDLSSNFCEFGAQYDSFVYAMRSLLKLPFSSHHTALILKKLKDVLHLLTYDGEVNTVSKEKLANELQCSIWKYDVKQLFVNDSSDILDAFSSLLQEHNSARKLVCQDMGFVYLLAVGVITKNVIAFNIMSPVPAGMKEAMVRRISQLDDVVLEKVSYLVAWFLRDDNAQKPTVNLCSMRFCEKVIDVCLTENTTIEAHSALSVDTLTHSLLNFYH